MVKQFFIFVPCFCIIAIMNKDKKFSLLILITALFGIGMVLSDIYVNIFIWRLKNNFSMICVYLMATYAVIPLFFYLNGILARHLDRVIIYRAGIAFYAAFYLSVILLGEKVSGHLIEIGILKGLAMGFYWFGYHILTFDYTSESNRDKFYGQISAISAASSMIAPPVAGYIIVKMSAFTGYYVVFSLTSVLFIAAVLLASGLKSEPVKHPYRIMDLIFPSNSRWRGVMLGFLFISMRDAITMFIFAVLIVKVTGSEFTLGKVAMFFSVVGVISAWLISKKGSPKKRLNYILYGSIIQFIVSLLLVYKLDFTMLLINAFFTPIADNLIRIPLNAHSLDVIAEDRDSDMRKMEYIAARDFPIAAGRITMLVVFMWLINSIPAEAVKIIIFTVSLVPFGIWLALKSAPPAHPKQHAEAVNSQEA